jgi:hypothetical protein
MMTTGMQTSHIAKPQNRLKRLVPDLKPERNRDVPPRESDEIQLSTDNCSLVKSHTPLRSIPPRRIGIRRMTRPIDIASRAS